MKLAQELFEQFQKICVNDFTWKSIPAGMVLGRNAYLNKSTSVLSDSVVWDDR